MLPERILKCGLPRIGCIQRETLVHKECTFNKSCDPECFQIDDGMIDCVVEMKI